jgi:nicotinic acid mononucleotide adenylyltransferase
VLFPGSFNPVHEGHVLLAQVAEELRQQPLAFEISVTNVDKLPLTGETVRHRLAQFAWKSPVELTRAPTFVEKSRLFPGTTFVVGADTAERLFGPIMATTRPECTMRSRKSPIPGAAFW